MDLKALAIPMLSPAELAALDRYFTAIDEQLRRAQALAAALQRAGKVARSALTRATFAVEPPPEEGPPQPPIRRSSRS